MVKYMPDIEPNSPYYHLIQLALDYRKLINLIEQGGLSTEEIQHLNGDRSVLHNQIIEEFAHLGQPVTSREEAMQKALRLVQWYPSDEEDYDV